MFVPCITSVIIAHFLWDKNFGSFAEIEVFWSPLGHHSLYLAIVTLGLYYTSVMVLGHP